MNFLFIEGYERFDMEGLNSEQRSWVMLMWLQVESMKSYFATTLIYILVSRIQEPALQLGPEKCPTQRRDKDYL